MGDGACTAAGAGKRRMGKEVGSAVPKARKKSRRAVGSSRRRKRHDAQLPCWEVRLDQLRTRVYGQIDSGAALDLRDIVAGLGDPGLSGPQWKRVEIVHADDLTVERFTELFDCPRRPVIIRGLM